MDSPICPLPWAARIISLWIPLWILLRSYTQSQVSQHPCTAGCAMVLQLYPAVSTVSATAVPQVQLCISPEKPFLDSSQSLQLWQILLGTIWLYKGVAQCLPCCWNWTICKNLKSSRKYNFPTILSWQINGLCWFFLADTNIIMMWLQLKVHLGHIHNSTYYPKYLCFVAIWKN